MITMMGKSRSVSLLKHFTDTHYKTQMVSMEMIRKGWSETVMKVKPTPETEPRWAHLHQPARQPLSLHHGRQGCQLVSLDQTARDTCWRGALAGWMMMRMPLWRLPRMEPPRASTMKLTKNLWKENDPIREDKERFSILQALRDELSHAVTKTHSQTNFREKIREEEVIWNHSMHLVRS